MNHQKIYESIIQKAKFENRIKLRKNDLNYIYYENHHILPKCLDGRNEKNNLVLLTPKEHFVCHKLLTYLYRENRKIICAFYYMSFNKKYGKIVSARDYAYAKELFNLIPVSKETREKIGKISKRKHSEESKEKARLSMIGKNVGRIQSEETKKKRALANTGKHRTKETKDKIRNSLVGITFTEERKTNISNSLKGKHFAQNFGDTSEENNGMYGISVYDLWVKKYGIEEANNRKEQRRQKLSSSLKGKNKKQILIND